METPEIVYRTEPLSRIAALLFISPIFRYHGREGWSPASYLKKADIQSQKLSAGAAAHASTNDIEGVSKQNHQNNADGENRDNKENRLSFLSDTKSKNFVSMK